MSDASVLVRFPAPAENVCSLIKNHNHFSHLAWSSLHVGVHLPMGMTQTQMLPYRKHGMQQDYVRDRWVVPEISTKLRDGGLLGMALWQIIVAVQGDLDPFTSTIQLEQQWSATGWEKQFKKDIHLSGFEKEKDNFVYTLPTALMLYMQGVFYIRLRATCSRNTNVMVLLNGYTFET